MAHEFTGKRVLITGGANGLGKSIVKKFYEAGADVFALDCDEVGLENLTLEFPNVHRVLVNLLDWDASKKAAESILPINHLVNNAGIFIHESVPKATEETLNRTFGVNFKAAVNLTQVFAAGVIENKLDGGTIVNISSVADTVTAAGAGAYGCSKAALTMLTRNSAHELGQYNIRVNCVRPTALDTKLFKEVLAHNGSSQKTPDFVTRAALKGDLQTCDVANLVYFLSSSQSSMITGEAVTIDAGASVI